MGGRPLAAPVVRGDPRCVRGGGGAVAAGRAARARAAVGRLGGDERRPAGDHRAVPGVRRRHRRAAAGVLPAADIGGVSGPAGADGDLRDPCGGRLSLRVDLLFGTRRLGRVAERGVHALRLPVVAGRRYHRAVLRVGATIVACQGIAGSAPPAGVGGDGLRRAAQQGSGRAPARRPAADAARRAPRTRRSP